MAQRKPKVTYPYNEDVIENGRIYRIYHLSPTRSAKRKIGAVSIDQYERGELNGRRK